MIHLPSKTPGSQQALSNSYLKSQGLLASIQSRTEDFRLVERVFYMYAPDGIGRSKLAAKVEKALGVPVTARNWNTVSKLLAMVHNLTGKSH